MMKHEFEMIAGYSVSADDYYDVIEPMYNATNLDKSDFVKCLDRKRFEIKVVKTEEQIALEERIKEDIQVYKEAIESNKGRIDSIKEYLSEETDKDWIQYDKDEIKRLKKEIKMFRAKILSLQFVLE